MNDVVLVVPTLDLYEPVWTGFLHGIFEYWSSCSFRVVFITNTIDAPYGETIKVGGDHTNWGGRMRRGLKQIDSPTIMWNLCDHWAAGQIDNGAILDFVKYIKRGAAQRIRLYPGWDHDKSSGAFRYDDRLLVMAKDSSYRCSCKPSLWDRGVLLRLLRDGESPWDFERRGQKRSAKYTFLALRNWGVFPFVTKGCPSGPWEKSPVIKGRWSRAALKYAKREGLEIDFGRHPVKKSPFGKNDTPSYILP